MFSCTLHSLALLGHSRGSPRSSPLMVLAGLFLIINKIQVSFILSLSFTGAMNVLTASVITLSLIDNR